MKSKPLLLASSLLVVVSAALWFANRSVHHPSASAKQEFGALIAGADSVSIEKVNVRKTSVKVFVMSNPMLQNELLNGLRFDEVSPALNPPTPALWQFDYRRGSRILASFRLAQGRSFSVLSGGSPLRNFRLNARSDASLRQKIKLSQIIMSTD